MFYPVSFIKKENDFELKDIFLSSIIDWLWTDISDIIEWFRWIDKKIISIDWFINSNVMSTVNI